MEENEVKKIKQLFKKGIALALAAVTTLSVLPASTVSAASERATITFAYCYDGNGNTIRYQQTVSHNGITCSHAGEARTRIYADGENAIDGVIETLSVMLRIEFENTKQKEDAECIGAALPVTQVEKWLSDTEMPDGVCMLSMTRKILEEGRKEGFDIGYLKGLMAAQSKE